jgi:hypothetical protein
VYGSLFLAVIVVFSFHNIAPAVEFGLHVSIFVFIHFSRAFFAKIVACFSPEADNITIQSMSLSINLSKFVSSQ